MSWNVLKLRERERERDLFVYDDTIGRLELNLTFRRELVLLHITCSMFGKFSMHLGGSVDDI